MGVDRGENSHDESYLGMNESAALGLAMAQENQLDWLARLPGFD